MALNLLLQNQANNEAETFSNTAKSDEPLIPTLGASLGYTASLSLRTRQLVRFFLFFFQKRFHIAQAGFDLTMYVAESDLELLILPSAPPCPAYVLLGWNPGFYACWVCFLPPLGASMGPTVACLSLMLYPQSDV